MTVTSTTDCRQLFVHEDFSNTYDIIELQHICVLHRDQTLLLFAFALLTIQSTRQAAGLDNNIYMLKTVINNTWFVRSSQGQPITLRRTLHAHRISKIRVSQVKLFVLTNMCYLMQEYYIYFESIIPFRH